MWKSWRIEKSEKFDILANFFDKLLIFVIDKLKWKNLNISEIQLILKETAACDSKDWNWESEIN